MRSLTDLVVVRGAGDLATGTIHALVSAGYPVVALEVPQPSSIRREVSFSEAVYDGEKSVEGITAVLAKDAQEALTLAAEGTPAILVDPACDILETVRPAVLIDAVLAKRNLGTHRDMAPLTIALGPGFEAGVDVDFVVETMRGPALGRVIEKGCALPNTGIPGLVGGFAAERVIHAPASGILQSVRKIGDRVEKGETIAVIEPISALRQAQGTFSVTASLTGVLRGLIRDGYPVKKGLKIADIDPRPDSYPLCFQISDKSRRIAQSVLTIVNTDL